MRALIQRVCEASVQVDGKTIGQIGTGLLVFAAVGEADSDEEVALLSRKIADLRIFDDEDGRFDLSVVDAGGEILLVSQFTLFADCYKGRRPSFIAAATAELAEPLIESMADAFRARSIKVQTGEFGARMQVRLINDGPVTIWLDTEELRR